MSWIDKAAARENEILRIIGICNRAHVELVLVGGYAVSAFGRHRFSVDCDAAVPRSAVPRLQRILRNEGYELKVEKAGFDQVYGGQFRSFSKKVMGFPVTVDLLIESLASRSTSASWSYTYIKKHSVPGVVAGIERSVNVTVPEKELLVAFKIHAGRGTDVRDIVILSGDLDLEKVRAHIQRGEAKMLRGQLEKGLEMLDDPRFLPSLKGVFTIRGDVSKRILTTKRMLGRLLALLPK